MSKVNKSNILRSAVIAGALAVFALPFYAERSQIKDLNNAYTAASRVVQVKKSNPPAAAANPGTTATELIGQTFPQ